MISLIGLLAIFTLWVILAHMVSSEVERSSDRESYASAFTMMIFITLAGSAFVLLLVHIAGELQKTS